MITTEDLPTSYKPYQELRFCSNRIIGGGHVFAMGKVVPLLIGNGQRPRIWLQAVSAPDSKEFLPVVSDSKAMHPAVNVRAHGKSVTVSVHGRTVLVVESQDEQHAVVSELDLRPLGLNIFGSSNGLSLGGMQMTNNTFANVGVAFGLSS